jgi:FtsP/CotA-like multicopper oxidase with cupredoxin domain
MRGLVIGLHVTPAPGYKEPAVAERRTIRLLAQKKPGGLVGRQTAYGFVMQQGDSMPARDSVRIPAPVLELRRGEPVRLLVKNTMDEFTGVHWHGLEIESFPTACRTSAAWAATSCRRSRRRFIRRRVHAAESGTFPYHSHLNELRQIGSGMYGAIVVTDGPRDTTRDHVIVAGGGGVPVFTRRDRRSCS